MGLLRTEIKEGNGKKFLHVFVKNYLDSIDIPLPPGSGGAALFLISQRGLSRQIEPYSH